MGNSALLKHYSIYSQYSNLPIVLRLSLIVTFPSQLQDLTLYVFGCHISSVSFKLNSSSPLSFLTLTFLGSTDWLYYTIFLIWGLSNCFLMIQVMHFWKEYYISDVSSENHIRRQMISICAITCDINFDHLAKGVSARFFHCKGAIFPF